MVYWLYLRLTKINRVLVEVDKSRNCVSPQCLHAEKAIKAFLVLKTNELVELS